MTALALDHLTLNTGHSRRSPRDEVTPETLQLLAPLVRFRGGRLPGGYREYRVTIVAETPGEAAFTVQRVRDNAPLVTCFVCWDRARATPLWDIVLAQIPVLARDFPPGFLPATLPPRPVHVPWLATLAWPTLLLDPDAAFWLGDFERCLAWALITAAA